MQPAYGGEQVGAEGHVGTAAALQDRQHLGEGVGHQVVGVGGGDQLPGQPSGGVGVAGEQLAVGVDVPAADAEISSASAGPSRRGRVALT